MRLLDVGNPALVVALTENDLAPTNGAALNVATPDMKFALHDPAIMTWPAIGAPIVSFATVPDALDHFASQFNVRLQIPIGIVERLCHGD